MVQESELQTFLFFDLETSSDYSTFAELEKADPRKASLWKTKHDKAIVKDPERWKGGYETSYPALAPLSAEFGRIVCGSFCHLITSSVDTSMRWVGKMKSFCDSERSATSESKAVLQPISDLLTNIERAGRSMRLCGHNIKKFDVPWLSKRMIMKGIAVPSQLQVWGKKPWEIVHFDTAEQWSMGNWEGQASLDLMSCVLGVPSPKQDMKGEYVGKVYWEENDIEKIRIYCEEDVKCVVKICHKLSGSTVKLEF